MSRPREGSPVEGSGSRRSRAAAGRGGSQSWGWAPAPAHPGGLFPVEPAGNREAAAGAAPRDGAAGLGSGAASDVRGGGEPRPDHPPAPSGSVCARLSLLRGTRDERGEPPCWGAGGGLGTPTKARPKPPRDEPSPAATARGRMLPPLGQSHARVGEGILVQKPVFFSSLRGSRARVGCCLLNPKGVLKAARRRRGVPWGSPRGPRRRHRG